jgi:hypothetical protein
MNFYTEEAFTHKKMHHATQLKKEVKSKHMTEVGGSASVGCTKNGDARMVHKRNKWTTKCTKAHGKWVDETIKPR